MSISNVKNSQRSYSYNSFSTGRKSKGNGTVSSKTQAYLAACNDQKMARNHENSEKKGFPKLVSVARISAIPIVETGLGLGEKFYTTLRDSNPIAKWYLTKAELTLQASMNLAIPTLNMFTGPISTLDKILCKSLDIVEQRVPNMYLPPEMMYSSAQDYMSSHIVTPVLRRADSVKQLGTAVLDSRVTAFAADTVDSVLDKADLYVDKYLPPDMQDAKEPAPAKVEENGAKQLAVVHTLQHADRFSRKLGRRLSRRTLMEARALKEHTTEAIHVLVYVAELVVTDPKLAYVKACELWKNLSKDEPDNQASPATLEQLIVLLTRESARRLVHLINFASSGVVKMPKGAVRSIRNTTRQLLGVASSLIQKVPFEEIKKNASQKTVELKTKFQILLQELQIHSMKILEQLALFIAGNTEGEKIRTPRCHLRNNHLFNANTVINGVN